MKDNVSIILLEFEKFKEIVQNDNLTTAQIITLFFKEYCNFTDQNAINIAKEIIMKGE